MTARSASRHRPLVAAFFAALTLALTAPPSFGPDSWWHLATGRWIWEHRALPAADPFAAAAADAGASPQAAYQLTQYWLAQVLLYGSYLAAGLKGAVLLRALVFGALFALLYRLLRRAGGGVLPCVLLVALACWTIVRELEYAENRPQMWSSLFFVALLLLLEHLREGKAWARPALPPFMLLWANLHGGYILGVLAIAIAAAEAGFSRRAGWRRTLLAAGAAVAAAGLNPAGYEALFSYPAVRLPGLPSLTTGIVEEDSLFAFVKPWRLPAARPALTAILALALATLLPRLRAMARERRDLLALLALTLALGIRSQRFLVFLVPVACLVTVRSAVSMRAGLPRLAAALGRPPWPGAPGRLTATVLVALTAALLLVAARSSDLRPGAVLRHEAEGAADYLAHRGITGNVFNEYTQGGYLAWRLSPRLRVFIYGRSVYPALLNTYLEVLKRPAATGSLGPDGRLRYRYQEVFDRQAIDVVVVPAGDRLSGDFIPLTERLAKDDGWALVHAEPPALVFLRRAPHLQRFVGQELPKSAVYDNLAAVARGAAHGGHGRAVPLWMRAEALAYYGKGFTGEALRRFDEYLALAPGDLWAIQMRDRVAKELGMAAPAAAPQ